MTTYDLSTYDLKDPKSSTEYKKALEELEDSNPDGCEVMSFRDEDHKLLIDATLYTTKGVYVVKNLCVLFFDFPTDEYLSHLLHGETDELIHKCLQDQMRADLEGDDDDEN